MCTAKFWPTIRFFFLNRLHSLMQNTFFYGELGMEFWKWNTGFCLLWHKKSIHVKPPQVEIRLSLHTPWALLSDTFTHQKWEEMILQYSSLRCNSAKCWLGEAFHCERCSAAGRSGTCCQPQNNADFQKTQSLQDRAQKFHASCRKRLS